MGRKDYRDKATVKRGPGRKTRKQKDPKVPAFLSEDVDGDAKDAALKPATLSSRQKKRQKKRIEKKLTGNVKLGKKVAPKVAQEEEPAFPSEVDLDFESADDAEDDDEPAKKMKLDLDGSDDDEEMMLEDDDFMDDEFPADEEDQDKEPSAAVPEGSDSGDDIAADDEKDLADLDHKINAYIQSLSSKSKKRIGESRSDGVSKLVSMLCSRFNYNQFLMEKVYDLYPKDILDFLQANEVDRPVTLRVNSLKTRRKELAQNLINRGVNLDPLDEWSKVGLVVYDSQVPLGATPEYLAGHYMLQGAASMLPVLALDPKPKEKVLDLCAAPGGKTTYIAELMKNTGLVMANEIRKDRAKAVVGNAHRHGLNNIVVCIEDGRLFPKTMHNFDRVLVDAPCTGTGVIAKDPSVKTNKDEHDILKCSHMQRQLLLAGIDCLKPGGVLVYCTCSVLVEENEVVVNYALKKRHVSLQETGLTFGEKAFCAFKGKLFHPSLQHARRFTPHQHNMDGFFVAKLIKHRNGPKERTEEVTEDT